MQQMTAHLQQRKEEVYLNLVLEYVPETVYKASRHYAKLKQTMPMSYIRLYMYQLFRSLAYIHCLGASPVPFSIPTPLTQSACRYLS